MNRAPESRWSDRKVNFMFGFLLGIVFCIGGVARRHDVSESIGAMLLIGLVCGTITALVGRRIWRWW